MIVLSSTTDKVELVTSGTADIDYTTHWADADNSSPPVVTVDNKAGAITSATTTDVTGSPASNHLRILKGGTWRNKHASSSNDLTLRHVKAGGTSREMFKVTLQAGWVLVLNEHGTYFVHDQYGGVVMGPVAASTTVAGLVMLADQTTQEAGTSVTTAVCPGNQHFHPATAKCWLYAGLTGNILASYNITSLTDTGTGVLTITIANDFSSVNYSSVGAIGFASTTLAQSCTFDSKAAGSIVMRSVVEAGSSADPVDWNMAAFGDL